MATKTQVVDGELVPSKELVQLTEDILMGRTEALGQMVEDSTGAHEHMIRRILEAEDEDAVLADDSLIAAKDLVDTPLLIHSFRVLKSALVDPDTGEAYQVPTKSAWVYDSLGLTINLSGSYTQRSDVTEEQLIGWVKNILGPEKIAELETQVTQMLEAA